ncbi:LysR family transcriptional regulator [Neorhizobium sp. DT-125]|uniref:LysR family transcriptional regulator n=1 Tax=Neorhizobium sp. DT-125 TaxID=3396163 RepID=UPI003F1D4AD5
MLNMRQLEIFWAIMRTGSMTGAGRLLGISQPAISRFIRHTEDQIGMQLFQRTSGGLQPTAEAEALFPIIDNIFENVEFARRAAIELKDSLSGRIKIASIPTLATELLPAPIASFMKQRPGVNIGLKVLPTKQVVDRVARQQVDLGILYGPIGHSALMVKDLCVTEIVAVVPRSHRLAEKGEITPEDLDGEAFISVNPHSPCGLLITETFERAGVKPRTRIECNHSLMTYSLVEAGVGIAIVEPLFFNADRVHDVVVKAFRPAIVIRPQVIYHGGRPLSRLNARFLAILSLSTLKLPLVQKSEERPARRNNVIDLAGMKAR